MGGQLRDNRTEFGLPSKALKQVSIRANRSARKDQQTWQQTPSQSDIAIRLNEPAIEPLEQEEFSERFSANVRLNSFSGGHPNASSLVNPRGGSDG